MDELVQKFEELRLAILQQEETADTIMQSVQALNAHFLSFHEQWSTLEDDEQLAGQERFLRTQANFHFVGSTILDQARFVQMPPAPPLSAADAATVNQLRFGDDVQREHSSTPANAHQNELKNSDEEEHQKMDIDAENQQSGQKPHQFNRNEVENAIEAAKNQNNDEDWSDVQSNELSSISFDQQAKLLEPIFKLPKMTSPNESTIDAMIKAIQRVLANASRRQLIVDQVLTRTLVQFMTTLFDPTTARCWAIRVMKGEPTFDLLINFLYDFNNVDGELKKKYTIPKIDNAESSQEGACESGEHKAANKSKAKKKTKGAAARSDSPSPNRQNNFKRPRSIANPTCVYCKGDHGVHLCPKFHKLSLQNREVELYRRSVCINCLSPTHTVEMCLDKPCKVCGKRHNSMLHHR